MSLRKTIDKQLTELKRSKELYTREAEKSLDAGEVRDALNWLKDVDLIVHLIAFSDLTLEESGEESKCEWTIGRKVWTGCDNTIYINHDEGEIEDYKYCPFCGKEISVGDAE